MKKRGIALAMSGLMVVSLLSACGKTNSTSTDSKNKGEATNKTITVSVQTGVGVQESWEAVAKAYEQKHSDVKIDIDLKAQEGYDQWVQTTFKTENPKADIVNINLAGNTKNGKSINYKDYIDNDSPYTDGTWGQQFDVSQQRIDGANGSFDALSLESVQVLWLYNQDIFDKVGVQPPKTWDEFIDVCNKISAAGYQPIAVAGNYDSFYSGQMGWLSQIYADQTTRSMVEKNRAQNGDFDFNADVDGKWKLDLNDPWNDDPGKVSQNPVRAFANVKNGIYRGDTDAMKAVWTNFSKVFPKFAGEDSFFGTDTNGAKTLFYQGKAAMTVDGGWGIVTFMKDMKALESGTEIKNTNGEAIQNVKKFTLGTFNMPSMQGNGFEAPARTIEVSNGFLGCISKDQAHNDLVIDFLMYYSSKEGKTVATNALLEAGGTINGPSLVYGVTYPDEVKHAFEQCKFIGNCQKDFNNLLARGIGESAETFRDFYQYSYDYLTGKISVDDWAKSHQKNIEAHLTSAMEEKGVGESDLANPQNEPSSARAKAK
nr:ABC transporter substrate-binding protein [Shuttleworthia satelles]